MTTRPLLPRRISTARLLLTAVRIEDAEAQVAAVNSSLREFRPWFRWAQQEQTVAAARERLRADAAAFDAGEEFTWFIREAQTGAIVGRISVFAIVPAVPKGEIGYWLTTSSTGRGYMREAVLAVTNQALAVGFRRLVIRCDSRNTASARVARAAGYAQDAVFRNDAGDAAHPTRLRHTVVFSRVT